MTFHGEHLMTNIWFLFSLVETKLPTLNGTVGFVALQASSLYICVVLFLAFSSLCDAFLSFEV